MAKIEAHGWLSSISPDEVAECWDGISQELYSSLWAQVAKYDNSYRENIEDIGPQDVVGLNSVADFWDNFSDDEKVALNAAAQRQQDDLDRLLAEID